MKNNTRVVLKNNKYKKEKPTSVLQGKNLCVSEKNLSMKLLFSSNEREKNRCHHRVQHIVQNEQWLQCDFIQKITDIGKNHNDKTVIKEIICERNFKKKTIIEKRNKRKHWNEKKKIKIFFCSICSN